MVPYIKEDETVNIIGETEELGSWQIDKAVELEYYRNRIFSTNEIELSKLYVEYKFVLKNAKGEMTWESGSNRTAQ